MKIKTECALCGKELLKVPSTIRKYNYCCREHGNIHKGILQGEKIRKENGYLTCDNCGKKFYKKKSHIGETNFCSVNCKKEYWNKKKITLNCKWCNREFITTTYRYTKKNSQFCSKECYDNYQKRNRIKTICLTCFKDIELPLNKVKNSKTSTFFCSQQCANEFWLSKVMNSNYKGITDITNGVRAYYENHQRWKIFKRDKHTCKICGEKAEEVHHIYPLYKMIEDFIRTHPEYDLNKQEDREKIIEGVINTDIFQDLNNLIAICINCHDNIFHNKGWKKEMDKMTISREVPNRETFND